MSNDTDQTTRPTLEELYRDVEHANVMRRQTTDAADRFEWRNEIGRLTQAIHREQMRRRAERAKK